MQLSWRKLQRAWNYTFADIGYKTHIKSGYNCMVCGYIMILQIPQPNKASLQQKIVTGFLVCLVTSKTVAAHRNVHIMRWQRNRTNTSPVMLCWQLAPSQCAISLKTFITIRNKGCISILIFVGTVKQTVEHPQWTALSHSSSTEKMSTKPAPSWFHGRYTGFYVSNDGRYNGTMSWFGTGRVGYYRYDVLVLGKEMSLHSWQNVLMYFLSEEMLLLDRCISKSQTGNFSAFSGIFGLFISPRTIHKQQLK